MSVTNQGSSTTGKTSYEREETSEDSVVGKASSEPEETCEDGVAPIKKGWCEWRHFDGNAKVKGLSYLCFCRGAVIMSNIFLSSALLQLANEEAGCIVNGNENESMGEDADRCDRNRIYGFKPESLITSIATVSGVLSALLLPVIGSLIDFTPHRRFVGTSSAVLLTLIQAVQIGTFSETWFAMSVLQAAAVFVFDVQSLAAYSYYPEIAKSVGQQTMTKFTAWFNVFENASQLLFLLIIVIVSTAAGLSDPQTGRVSQGVNVALISIGFIVGWKLVPDAPTHRALPNGHFLLLEGFRQNFQTMKNVAKYYKKGLGRFLLATAFTEAIALGFISISVTFMDQKLKLSAMEIGYVFLVGLVCTMPGSYHSAKFCAKYNPKISLIACLTFWALSTLAGSLSLDESQSEYIYLYVALWGFSLGWYYPSTFIFFSMCLPPGQEAGFTGFYLYFGKILSWLPPLVFTVLVESGMDQKWGLMSMIIYMVIAILILSMTVTWEQILEESDANVELRIFNHGAEGEEEENV